MKNKSINFIVSLIDLLSLFKKFKKDENSNLKKSLIFIKFSKNVFKP